MKKVLLIVAIVLCTFCLFACTNSQKTLDEGFEFCKEDFVVIEELDTHGGFHGDGSYYLILDCSEKREQAMELIKDWTPLPLTENLQLIMYGGEKDGVNYVYNLAEEAHWPIINNGVYKFVDRHQEAVAKSDDTELFNRYSFNFSIAAYDLDTNTLYYFEFDT